MSRIETVVPAESDILCESCGYTLNGLPETGNCPECGVPIEQSLGSHRHLSPFETDPNFKTFVQTTRQLIFHTSEFFRTITVRTASTRVKLFARIHSIITTVIFMLVVTGHSLWLFELFSMDRRYIFAVVLLGGPVLFLLMAMITRLATWLSAIEAKYWGMRLPYPVVARGLAFHAAHYLPVGLLANAVVWGYRLLIALEWTDHRSDTRYLYSLSIVVLLSAGYLFRTYWIAMRNMMHANR